MTQDTGTSIVTGFLVAILIVVVVYIVVVLMLRRRTESRTVEEQDRETGDLARRANHDLIATDEAVRDARQEMGFAEAEFDDPDIAPSRDATDQAASHMKAAFAIRQQLDDEIPEDADTRRQMLESILRHTTAAEAVLRAQSDQLQQLREARRQAPEVLQQAADQLTTLTAHLAVATTTLGRLTAYAPASWQSVTGNAAEADKRIAFARDAVARGQTALTTQDQRGVGAAIRDAQGAIGEATSLLDAVDRLAISLDDAAARLPDELTAAATDVGAARQALSSSGTGADQQQRLTQAEQALAAARAAAALTPPDVLEAFTQATAANSAADAVVAAVREATARIARRQAVLDGAIRAAAMAVAQAGDFIETRRGGVGTEARTRLVEAQRQLDQANATQHTDPDSAIGFAQRAQSIANDAYLIASQDFSQFDQQGPPGNAGALIGGQILGGILGGMLSGGWSGGRRGSWGGGGWGGTPWGSPPSSGQSGSDGPGGGGGRSRGGSWGGLGGRSRGGRW